MAILVFAAHPDDEILGAGGTIAKYASEGKEVVTIIFSFGEGSDPTAWTLGVPISDPVYLTSTRAKESVKASKMIGTKEVIFLGLRDQKFAEDIKRKDKIIKEILERYQPSQIFTHCPDDPHPAHRLVANLIKDCIKEANLKSRPKMYTFTIFSPLRFINRNALRKYVDISDTFTIKKKALRYFKTQKQYLDNYYIPLIQLQNWIDGFKSRCKYAEVFYKW